MLVKPYLDDILRGVFATRAPRRPNNIGLSIVRLQSVKNNIIKFTGADMLDKTPLLDIKPFIPPFDVPKKNTKIGWLEDKIDEAGNKKADNRF